MEKVIVLDEVDYSDWEGAVPERRRRPRRRRGQTVRVTVKFLGPSDPDGKYSLMRCLDGETVVEREDNILMPTSREFVLPVGCHWRIVALGLEFAQFCSVEFDTFSRRPKTVEVRCAAERNYGAP